MAVSRKAPDGKTKVSSADTTPGFLEDELQATEGVKLTKLNPAADEKLQASLDIPGLSEDFTPDLANDFVATYDVSGTVHRKVKMSNLPSGGGGVEPHRFDNFLTGCTTFPDCPPVLCFCNGNLVQGCS